MYIIYLVVTFWFGVGLAAALSVLQDHYKIYDRILLTEILAAILLIWFGPMALPFMVLMRNGDVVVWKRKK